MSFEAWERIRGVDLKDIHITSNQIKKINCTSKLKTSVPQMTLKKHGEKIGENIWKSYI